MSLLFNRQLYIEVGDGDNFIKLDNRFKITFSLQKTISGNTATGNVTIYNLSDATIGQIQDRGSEIRIYAGYGNKLSDAKLQHDGDLLRLEQVDEQTNKKTVLVIGDKVFKKKQAITKTEYQNTVKIKDIIKDNIPTFNLDYSQDTLDKIPDDATLPSYTYSGKTSDMFNKLLSPLNLGWYENNQEIKIDKANEDVSSDDQVYILNSNTGLIKTATKSDRGVTVTSLLITQIQIGDTIKIESDVVSNAKYFSYNTPKPSKQTDGFYKVIQQNIEGDSWGDGQFKMVNECRPYGENQQNQESNI